MAEGGSVSLSVIPSFSSFGSLFSNGIRGALSTAETEGKRISAALGGGLKAGVTAGVAAVGIAIGDFVTKSVREYERLGEQTRQLQHVTGASAQEASTFASVISHLGGTVESVSKGLGIFGANIATQPELFQKYGVAIAYSRGGAQDLLGTLENLRQKFQADGNVTERNAEAKKLLGRSYQALLPYLNLTNQQLAAFQQFARASGQVISQADVDRARQLQIDTRLVQDRLEGIKVAVGRAATGGLHDFFIGLDVIAQERGPLQQVKDVIGGLLGRDWSTPSARQAAANIDAAGRAAEEAAIHYGDLSNAEDAVSKAAEGARQADRSLADANRAVAKAQEGVAQAERGVAKARENTQHAAEGVARAEQGVQKAAEGTQRAREQEARAEQNLGDLLAKGAVDAKQVEEADRGLEAANRGVRDSVESLATATEHLNELQAFAGVDAADELTDAHLRLSQATLQLAQARLQASRATPTLQDPFAQRSAQLSVQTAQQQQRKAQEDLAKVNQFGTQTDHQLADAQKQVRDATERVGDALQQQTDAQKKLSEAQAGDPDFQKKVAEAKRQVAEAALAVRDAQQGERDADLAVQDAEQSLVDAHQGESDAAAAVRDAEDAVAQAQDNVQEQTYKARDAHDALTDAFGRARGAGLDLDTVIDDLIAKYPELARVLDAFKNLPPPPGYSVNGTVDIVNPGAVGLNPPPGARRPDGSIVGRASGGDVVAGRTYRINELRNETVTFPADGYVNAHPANLTPMGGDGSSIDYGQLSTAVAQAVAAALEGMGIYVGEQQIGEAAYRGMGAFRRAVAGRQ